MRNPTNDARDMSEALKELGFKVTTLIDAGYREMYEAIRDFGMEVARYRDGVGLFYYAGHGMQVGGVNYLIPVGSDIEAEDEVRFQSIDAGLVLSKMESAGNRTNIVILDACRDNPFKRSFRTESRGLAVVEAPRGSLLVYATSPGSVAEEGRGRNGVFTGALLKHIGSPNIEVRDMLTRVRRDVIAATAGILYLDGARQAELPVGASARIENLETGTYNFQMRYKDGKQETKTITVYKDTTASVAFTYRHAPKVPEGFVLVEAGSFRMGSNDGAWDEKPVHTVRITRDFYI